MRNHLIALFVIATVISFSTYAAPTENKSGVTAADYDTMKKNVESLGFNFGLANSNKDLDITMDQAKVLAAAPELSKEDVIVKLDEKDLKEAPLSVSIYAVGVTMSVTILTGVYAKNSDVDKLHVTLYVKPAAGGEKQPCYSFDYTRDLYDKLSMEISANDFIAQAPAFEFSPYCQSGLEKENKAAS